jgi:cobalt-zinc-cadmium efflux system membrane fusion protein
MWLTLNVRQDDVQRLALGQPVRFRADGDGQEVTGAIAWISTAVDQKTRTVKIRADLDNRSGRLRANTFGPGRIILREEKHAVVVPTEAIQWEGDCNIVAMLHDATTIPRNRP